MKTFKKIITAAMLAGAIAPAWAANVLFLTTNETKKAGAQIVDSAWDGISAAAAASGDTLVDRRNTLSAAGALDEAAIQAADIVVVMTVYAAADATKLDKVTSAITSQPDKTFVIFTDACCERPANLDKFVSTVNTVTGWNITAKNVVGKIDSPLNTNSPYSAEFTSLKLLEGQDYGLVYNVPGENALYLPANASLPANSARTTAFGFFAPKAAMNGGACTFLMADTSPFYLVTIGAVQGPDIMSNFLTAAKDTAGACKKASAVADLKPSISGPTTASVGDTVTLDITVDNLGAGASTDGVLDITLPPGVRSTATLPNGCTVAPGATPSTAETVSCTLAGIAASGNTPLSLPVQVQQDGSFEVKAQISSVTGENIISNNTASHSLTATVADLKPTISGPSSAPVGDTVSLDIAIDNLGASASTDGMLAITLPPGLRSTGTLPANCTVAPGATDTTPETLNCTLAGLAASGNTVLTLPDQVKQEGSFEVTAQISSVTGESNTGNNSASHTLSGTAPVIIIPPTASATPVPVGGWPMLALLTGVLSLFAWRRKTG